VKRAANARDDDGYTPLHFAVKTGDLPAAKWLTERKADMNARDATRTAAYNCGTGLF